MSRLGTAQDTFEIYTLALNPLVIKPEINSEHTRGMSIQLRKYKHINPLAFPLNH